jgi:leader peptidase (prepilin peptidase) / N-methyltransferase
MLFILVLFLFGLVWGSAVNVMIYRNKTAGEINSKLVGRRSRCPYCGKKIAWYDNIPLLSFFLLKGRCRHCGKKISWQYPLVELATALLVLVFVILKTDFENIQANILSSPIFGGFWMEVFIWVVQLICIFAIVGILVAIFVYDLKYFLIPNIFVLGGGIAAVLYNLIFDLTAVETGFKPVSTAFPEPVSTAFLNSATVSGFLGALIAAGFFFCLVYFSREKWMGWGDVKFAVFMGLILGFPLILVGLAVAYFIGSVVGIGLVLLKKKKMKAEIPFGPFLCLGTYISLIFGHQIIAWYLKIIL